MTVNYKRREIARSGGNEIRILRASPVETRVLFDDDDDDDTEKPAGEPIYCAALSCNCLRGVVVDINATTRRTIFIAIIQIKCSYIGQQRQRFICYARSEVAR